MMHLGTGTMCVCAFGVAPSVLNVIKTELSGNLPGGNNLDMAPILNVPPFGMCNAPSNPAVIAATSAALGVPTPAPCVPVLVGPWLPGPVKSLITMLPAITSISMLMCAYGGVITPTVPGQFKVMILS